MNSAGRLIAIAHGTAGHLILDANLQSPTDSTLPPTIIGSFKLEFADGSEYEGTFETALSRPTTTS